MSYSLSVLLTNEDGLLIGHSEIDYSQLPDHLIEIDGLRVPFNVLVNYTHQALLKDYDWRAPITTKEILQYWESTKIELRGAGSIEIYNQFLSRI
ncbi:MAG: hypothetical protein AB1489_36850 [Acidobacteriota bacterium]